MNGRSGGAPAQPPPDPAEAQIGGRVRRVDVLVRQEKAPQKFHSGLFAQVVLVAQFVDQMVHHCAEVVSLDVQQEDT